MGDLFVDNSLVKRLCGDVRMHMHFHEAAWVMIRSKESGEWERTRQLVSCRSLLALAPNIVATVRHPLKILMSLYTHNENGSHGWENLRIANAFDSFNEFLESFCDAGESNGNGWLLDKMSPNLLGHLCLDSCLLGDCIIPLERLDSFLISLEATPLKARLNCNNIRVGSSHSHLYDSLLDDIPIQLLERFVKTQRSQPLGEMYDCELLLSQREFSPPNLPAGRNCWVRDEFTQNKLSSISGKITDLEIIENTFSKSNAPSPVHAGVASGQLASHAYQSQRVNIIFSADYAANIFDWTDSVDRLRNIAEACRRDIERPIRPFAMASPIAHEFAEVLSLPRSADEILRYIDKFLAFNRRPAIESVSHKPLDHEGASLLPIIPFQYWSQGPPPPGCSANHAKMEISMHPTSRDPSDLIQQVKCYQLS